MPDFPLDRGDSQGPSAIDADGPSVYSCPPPLSGQPAEIIPHINECPACCVVCHVPLRSFSRKREELLPVEGPPDCMGKLLPGDGFHEELANPHGLRLIGRNRFAVSCTEDNRDVASHG